MSCSNSVNWDFLKCFLNLQHQQQTKICLISNNLHESKKVWFKNEVQKQIKFQQKNEVDAFFEDNILEKQYPSCESENKEQIKIVYQDYFEKMKSDDGIDIFIIVISEVLSKDDCYAVQAALNLQLSFCIIPNEKHSYSETTVNILKEFGLNHHIITVDLLSTIVTGILNILEGYNLTKYKAVQTVVKPFLVKIETTPTPIIHNIDKHIKIMEMKEETLSRSKNLSALNDQLKKSYEKRNQILEFENTNIEQNETILADDALDTQQPSQPLEEEVREFTSIRPDNEINNFKIDFLPHLEEEDHEKRIQKMREEHAKQMQKIIEEHIKVIKQANLHLQLQNSASAVDNEMVDDETLDDEALDDEMVDNELVDENIRIEEKNKSKNIAILGVTNSGRSSLINALAGGIRPHQLSQNLTETSDFDIYKLSYPNDGIVGSTREKNLAVFEEFFEITKMQNLSVLLIAVYGTLSDSDYYAIMTAQKLKIPVAIIVTKLDEWLDNSTKTQKEYVDDEKTYFCLKLNEVKIANMEDKIFHISAFANIHVAKGGLNCRMAKYKQDEMLLQQFLAKHGIKWQNPFEDENDEMFADENDEIICEQPPITRPTVDAAIIGRCQRSNNLLKEKLRKTQSSQKTFACFDYNDTVDIDEFAEKLNETSAKLFIFVLQHPVDSIYAKLIQHFDKSKKVVIFIRNKNDETADNHLEMEKGFIENSIEQSKQYAREKLEQFNVTQIPIFCVSIGLISSVEEETWKIEDEDFLNFVRENI